MKPKLSYHHMHKIIYAYTRVLYATFSYQINSMMHQCIIPTSQNEIQMSLYHMTDYQTIYVKSECNSSSWNLLTTFKYTVTHHQPLHAETIVNYDIWEILRYSCYYSVCRKRCFLRYTISALFDFVFWNKSKRVYFFYVGIWQNISAYFFVK